MACERYTKGRNISQTAQAAIAEFESQQLRAIQKILLDEIIGVQKCTRGIIDSYQATDILDRVNSAQRKMQKEIESFVMGVHTGAEVEERKVEDQEEQEAKHPIDKEFMNSQVYRVGCYYEEFGKMLKDPNCTLDQISAYAHKAGLGVVLSITGEDNVE